ncbi:MAG: tRNA threonylcarbamoyladenosine dehydratase [Clostridia bacterium]|nr:tRNA threonylcarbamoyladenosine dehydratase [Clostridia bacterium]MDY5555255.1 tRNA threonylcarbamoyladenosine dehydratase [Blautia sp.]
MPNAFSRMEILLGDQGAEKLSRTKIAIFGLGGVGSFAAEALARCGVACLTLVDYAAVSVTNINRELYALRSTVGKSKVQVAKERIQDIDDGILVNTYETYYNEDTAEMFDLSAYDYIIDALDTVSSKLLLIERAKASGTPVISCMGTGNKTDPFKFAVSDIFRISACPLVKTMRSELRKRGIHKVKVLYSREKETKPDETEYSVNGSISFVPGVAGLMIAGAVVKDLLEDREKDREAFYRKRKTK